MRAKWTNLISLLTALLLIFSAVPAFAAESEGQPERAYQVDFKVLKDGTDEVSAADQYVQKPAKVTVEDGVGYAELTLLKSGWIAKFEVEQDGTLQAASVTGQDEAADTRTVKFRVGNIREKTNARFVVEVPAMNYKGEYNVQLSFDTTGMPGGSKPAEEAEATDGSNEVQLSVLKDGTDEPSSLGNYASKTGKLYERDGAYFLTFTLFSSSMITAFQYENGEKFVDSVVLSEDKDADSRTVGIVVTDVTKKQNIALEVNAGPRGVMKHKAQIVLSAASGSSEGSGEAAQPTFRDIQEHWAKTAIEEAVKHGIVQGYEDHTFKPDNQITRAQAAVIFANALKLNQAVEIPNASDEADIPGYAAAAVKQVRAAGLMSGYDDGAFRPNASLNRAELAVIIAKAKGLKVTDGAVPSFSDAGSIPVWAQPSVAAAVEAGLISGRSEHTFAPADIATRAEIVTLVIKLLASSAAK
ncbi:NEAT domain-containing protein [Paenibacillus contaminans]|uniref:NEAT domain-containing protein n=1 Tax=Paenibacillus contaminans TaxID=450362 RepID=UPI00131403D5|nr:NEAT domain-containing protein [Paenibacillus contaminans]